MLDTSLTIVACPNRRIALWASTHPDGMPDALIERAEVVALLFTVSDIAVTLTNIERPLGEDDGEEKIDQG
jgi:hypothetical protein